VIFVSIGLLVVAAIALGIGISGSSQPPLVISILVTLAAAATMWASFIRYRKEAVDRGLAVAGLGGNQARLPGYPGAYEPGAPEAAVGAGLGFRPARSSIPADWDAMPEDDAAAAVEACNLDELHELRRHEVEHEHRDGVLAAVDTRIEAIVALRRRLASR
jgi:hypothetical protein